MVSCASCGYSKTANHVHSGVTFHRFPKDGKRRTLWIQFMKNPELILKTTSVLCSQHFTEDCFDRTSKVVVRLLPNAIPTIEVDRLKYDRTYNLARRPSIPEEDTLTYPEISSIAGPSSTPRLFIREQTPPPSENITSVGLQDTPRKTLLKRKISELESTNILKSQKIRSLQKINWKQKRKISSLKSLLSELKKKIYCWMSMNK